jgi:hypothetical protein
MDYLVKSLGTGNQGGGINMIPGKGNRDLKALTHLSRIEM